MHAILPPPQLFTRLCFCAGCHRHRQVQLLPEVRVPRAPQPCGRPHQLRALADFQQLHFRVGLILTPGVNGEGGRGGGGKKKNQLSVFCCSPSICHSDSDLSEGSRKYSPSSETSLETQRACGKAQTWRTRSHASKRTKKKEMCGASFIKPSLTEMEEHSSGQTILSAL